MTVLLQISWRMLQWRHFENLPVFDEVMCRLRWLTFLAHPVWNLLADLSLSTSSRPRVFSVNSIWSLSVIVLSAYRSIVLLCLAVNIYTVNGRVLNECYYNNRVFVRRRRNRSTVFVSLIVLYRHATGLMPAFLLAIQFTMNARLRLVANFAIPWLAVFALAYQKS